MDSHNKKRKGFIFFIVVATLWYCNYVYTKIEEGKSKTIIGWIDDYYVDKGVLPDSLSELGPRNYKGRKPYYHKVDMNRYVIYYFHSFDGVVAWHSWRGKWENKLNLTPLDSTIVGYMKQVVVEDSLWNENSVYAVSFGDSIRIAPYGYESEYFNISDFVGFIRLDSLKMAIFDSNKTWQNILYNPYFFEKINYGVPKENGNQDSLRKGVFVKTFSMPKPSGKLN